MEEIEKFARICDATGEPMNEGWMIGEKYFKYQEDADKEAQTIPNEENPEQGNYKNFAELYESWESEDQNDFCYWTQWDVEEEETYFDEDGLEWFNFNDELFTKVFNKAKTEILADIENGTLPKTVKSYYEMNDFVDANCYGGFCEEDYISSKNFEFEIKVQEAVENWLKTREI